MGNVSGSAHDHSVWCDSASGDGSATGLLAALGRDEIQIVYQPIVALADGRVDGAEALLRWRHPVRGDIAPAEFVPAAEESGDILAVGRWVLDHTCRTPPAGLPVRMGLVRSCR